MKKDNNRSIKFPTLINKDKDNVLVRVDSKTEIYVPKNASPEQRESIKLDWINKHSTQSIQR
jgi:hypothetical protein